MTVTAIVKTLTNHGNCYVLNLPVPAKMRIIEKKMGKAVSVRNCTFTEGYILEVSKEVKENVGR